MTLCSTRITEQNLFSIDSTQSLRRTEMILLPVTWSKKEARDWDSPWYVYALLIEFDYHFLSTHSVAIYWIPPSYAMGQETVRDSIPNRVPTSFHWLPIAVSDSIPTDSESKEESKWQLSHSMAERRVWGFIWDMRLWFFIRTPYDAFSSLPVRALPCWNPSTSTCGSLPISFPVIVRTTLLRDLPFFSV